MGRSDARSRGVLWTDVVAVDLEHLSPHRQPADPANACVFDDGFRARLRCACGAAAAVGAARARTEKDITGVDPGHLSPHSLPAVPDRGCAGPCAAGHAVRQPAPVLISCYIVPLFA